MKPAAGRLRHFITFQSPAVAQVAGSGARVESWTDEFNGAMVPASIQPVSGTEFIAAAATQHQTDTRIVLRHLPGIKPSWRARHRDQVYDIKAVLPDAESLQGHITLLCRSGLNNG